MGMKIYDIRSWSVPETQESQDRIYQERLASGEWHEDDIMAIKMPIIEHMRIKAAVKAATEGKEKFFDLARVDMHGKIELPIIYEMYIDYLETWKADYLSRNVMTRRMLDVILSTGVNATSYPVAILERKLIREMSEEQTIKGIYDQFDEGVDELVREFRPKAEPRYYMLHLLEDFALFNPELSNRSEGKYVLVDSPPALPPFFRVAWGPISALLCTEEGKKKLEDAKLLGVHFSELEG